MSTSEFRNLEIEILSSSSKCWNIEMNEILQFFTTIHVYIKICGFKILENYPGESFGLKFIPNQSETFPNHSEICIRIKQFHSDLVRRNFWIRIKPIPIQNQSKLIRIRMNSVNPHGFIRVESSNWLDWFGLTGFIRIESSN